MNISYRWLTELAPDLSASAADVADRLTRTAVPVDEVTWLGQGLEDIVVARVEEISPHPNADRLVLCQVETGDGERVQVVTGAPNVTEGAFYPFVGAGSSLPDGREIETVELRGAASEGMLCSERELGLGRDQSGIMRLSGTFTPGQLLVDALALDDHRLVLDVTPNRPDLLGHWGVAREVGPAGAAGLRLPAFPEGRTAEYRLETVAGEGPAADVSVRVDDPEGSPRYMGLVIDGVTVGPSPEWLAGRLRAIGLQPINNVVDATNYVLYELNQPLHAFDLDRLRGRQVIVRSAEPGERLRTLDGRERQLSPEILVIADAEGASALAGIMGGEGSEVGDETQALFIECAYFDPKRVRSGRRQLGLDTDASFRFERGIDPGGMERALQRVADLILDVAGGTVKGPAVDVTADPPAGRSLSVRISEVERVLGAQLTEEAVQSCLEPIGFSASPFQEGEARVQVPTWRPDVQREIDLIEEIARRYGYDRFSEEVRPFRPTAIEEEPFTETLSRLRQFFVGLGFMEARSVPFVSARHGDVQLQNPLSEEEDRLRRGLLGGLVGRVEHNFAHGQRDIRLFEIGTVFAASDEGGIDETVRVSAAWTGARSPEHWTSDAEDWDVWDLSWLLEEAGRIACGASELRPADPNGPPQGLSDSYVLVDDDAELLGWGGRVQGDQVDTPPWSGAVWGLEIDVRPLQRPVVEYRPLPVFPTVERDLALLVPGDQVAAEVSAVIRSAGSEILESLSIFDVYEGAGIPEDTRSIAWRLRFRAPDRTLTDREVDAAVKRITAALKEELDVRVRGA